MAVEELCGECGVPRAIGEELDCGDNGVIYVAGSPRNRMILYESNVIDNLLRGVEELIGLNIQHMVIESRRREIRRFFEKSIPLRLRGEAFPGAEDPEGGETPEGADGESALKVARAMWEEIIALGKVHGYGKAVEGDEWDAGAEHPWRTATVSHPYSLPFWVAEMLGAVEAFGGDRP